MDQMEHHLLLNDDDLPPPSPGIVRGMIDTIKLHRTIIIWCVASVLTSVLQGVYIKLAGTALASFPYFLFWSTSIAFVLCFFIYYWILLLWSWKRGGTVGKSGQLPMIIIGSLNALNGIFILYANPNVPGIMQALLGPTIVVIPMAMVLSFLLLKRRYNRYQIIAVVVIVLGLGVAMLPSFLNLKSGGGSSQFGTVFWNIIFLLGSVPAALQTVYQEKTFTAAPVDLAFMLAWSSLWQSTAIVLSFPVDAIPHFGTASSFKDIFTMQAEAFWCTIGRPSAQTYAICPACDCDHAGLYVGLFVLAYVVSSFTSLGVVKYGNATFSFIVSTLSTPMTMFAFAWPFLMGNQAESISPYNYGSLAMLLVGVIGYRIFDKHVTAKHVSVVLPKHESIHAPEIYYSFGSGAAWP